MKRRIDMERLDSMLKVAVFTVIASFAVVGALMVAHEIFLS